MNILSRFAWLFAFFLIAQMANKTTITIPLLTTDAEFSSKLKESQALVVVDVFSKWAGPCEAMLNFFKRIKSDHQEKVEFYQAVSDTINALQIHRNKSKPTFLIYIHNILVAVIRGVNTPQIEKTIIKHLELEKQGLPHPPYNEKGMIPLHERKRTALKEAVLQSVDPNLEQTLALIKPNAMSPFLVEQIMEIIRKHRFEVLIKKKIWLTKDQVMKFYAEHEGRPFFNNLVDFLSAAPIFALVLAREDAVKTWREVMGPTNPNRAREDAPRSIRALCGVDNLINSVYGSDSVEAAKRDIALLFESDMSQSIMDIPYVEPEGASSVSQKTFAILKPDMAGYPDKVDAIIQKIIWSGMTVYKREEFQMTREQASELYALHKGKEFFEEAISFLSSGPCVGLVLKGDDVIRLWRELIGPFDPEEARNVYPMSIRALFGTSKVRNAVHGSDTVEAANRELQIAFPNMVNLSRRSSIQGSSLGSHLSLTKGSANNLTSSGTERTIAMIKAHILKQDAETGTQYKQDIVWKARDAGFDIVVQQEMVLTQQQANDFFKEHAGTSYYSELINEMTSGPSVILVLEKDSAIADWKKMIGPMNPSKAQEVAPESFRAKYGVSNINNAVHGSDSVAASDKEAKAIFGVPCASIERQSELSSKNREYTFAFIKPDAYSNPETADKILTRISMEGFNIVLKKEMILSLDTVKEFYKEHADKVFYQDLVTWMSSAPVLALVLEKANAVAEWRILAGPTNSEKARKMAPSSIRALTGKDGSQNAVHGSDSLASAEREIKLIFGKSIQEIKTSDEKVSSSPIAQRSRAASSNLLDKIKAISKGSLGKDKSGTKEQLNDKDGKATGSKNQLNDKPVEASPQPDKPNSATGSKSQLEKPKSSSGSRSVLAKSSDALDRKSRPSSSKPTKAPSANNLLDKPPSRPASSSSKAAQAN